MDIVAALEALEGQGIGLLEAIAAGKLNKQRIVSFGYSSSTAGAWVRLADTFLGPTRPRRLQTQAVSAARDGRLSIDALRVVDKHARKLLPGATLTEWELRAELCTLTGSVDEINYKAAARVREINRTIPDAERKSFGRRSLKGGKNTDAQGLRTITVTLPERIMANTLTHLRKTAGRLRASDPKLGYEQAMADAFLTHINGQGPERAPQSLTPLVVIGLPEWAALQRHEADESIFALTDGTTITGAELVRSQLAEHHLVGLYDPVEGPVNLYRSQRHANTKQRLLLSAEVIVCPVPGCTTSADECQVHHLAAWQHGGTTNLRNMAMACKVHNGRNDDDPTAAPRHGRLARHQKQVKFHPPDGGPPRTNHHPITRLSASALVT